ncbi:hypothetical protein SR882_10980 [Guyparkeria halophila]|uniref:Tetratricopeptide repeat protein n=1 Tax=Guyparkeria halophila TaxID=47960 RepID=A0ABZ0YXG7_9GAMM|nr:hypothetical protein [Guyparkeria halophila]WQH16269.1 hypothetical protein SR882_10980 [Guyparkeria halophila]
MMDRTKILFLAGVMAASLTIVWAAYRLALTGSFHFDDFHNLAPLRFVADGLSLFGFVTGGTAGPLGRPMTLATFFPQHYAWPVDPSVFLYWNVLIHILNGLLVTWFVLLSERMREQPESRAVMVAAVAGVLWVSLPILASSSLMVVQRMTTLSALFLFLGLIGYLKARAHIETRPYPALVGMTLSLLVFGALSVLSKENGALLFVFVFLLEMLLFTGPTRLSRRLWLSWKILFFGLPSVVLMYLVVSSLWYPESVVKTRGFDGWERLLTQQVVLWEYVKCALLPTPGCFSPFHDDYTLVSPVFWGPALAAWMLVAVAAIWLRRLFPVIALGVLWFLVGHALESSTISLEMYFEHRNYVPAVGLTYAIAAAIFLVGKKHPRLAVFGGLSYYLSILMILLSTTSLWGRPALAAEIWHIERPESVRSSQYLAGRLQEQGYYVAAAKIIKEVARDNPAHLGLRLQDVYATCLISPKKSRPGLWREMYKDAKDASFNHGVYETLSFMDRNEIYDKCSAVSRDDLFDMARSLLLNPQFGQRPVTRHNLHIFLAEEGVAARDLGLTMSHLEEAFDAYPNINTVYFVVDILISAGLYSEAFQFIEEAEEAPPHGFLSRIKWSSALKKVEQKLRATRAQQGAET